MYILKNNWRKKMSLRKHIYRHSLYAQQKDESTYIMYYLGKINDFIKMVKQLILTFCTS